MNSQWFFIQRSIYTRHNRRLLDTHLANGLHKDCHANQFIWGRKGDKKMLQIINAEIYHNCKNIELKNPDESVITGTGDVVTL